MLGGDHATRASLARRLGSNLLSLLRLVTIAYVDDGVVNTVGGVLLRGAGPVAALGDGNPALLVSIGR